MAGWLIPKDVPLAITVVVGEATPIIIRSPMPAVWHLQRTHPQRRLADGAGSARADGSGPVATALPAGPVPESRLSPEPRG